MAHVGAHHHGFAFGARIQPLTLKSRGGEIQTATLNPEPIDGVTGLDPEARLRAGQSCGAIVVGGVAVGMAELNEGAIPAVALLCRGEEDPTVFPAADLYQFLEITRTKSTKDRNPSTPCVDEPPGVAAPVRSEFERSPIPSD